MSAHRLSCTCSRKFLLITFTCIHLKNRKSEGRTTDFQVLSKGRYEDVFKEIGEDMKNSDRGISVTASDGISKLFHSMIEPLKTLGLLKI